MLETERETAKTNLGAAYAFELDIIDNNPQTRAQMLIHQKEKLLDAYKQKNMYLEQNKAIPILKFKTQGELLAIKEAIINLDKKLKTNP